MPYIYFLYLVLTIIFFRYHTDTYTMTTIMQYNHGIECRNAYHRNVPKYITASGHVCPFGSTILCVDMHMTHIKFEILPQGDLDKGVSTLEI